VLLCALLAEACLLGASSRSLTAEDRVLHHFERKQLTDTYYSEGANAGDVNHDGQPDIVYGPYWYAGPDFKIATEIYTPKAQPLDFYADNFFNWVYDFNHDGWGDIFVVGFPGTPAYVYENPQAAGGHWKKHQVFESVSNESPHFINLVGDEPPELVCTFGGKYGFATFDAAKPFESWTFHAVADAAAPERFGHGLGVGDVNGDGRLDMLMASGWFEQPAENAGDAPWEFHSTSFTPAYGGAEMYAYDVDDDGDNDVITSLAAHDYGLAWFEQDTSREPHLFRQRTIVGQTPEESRYGLVFSELHSVALADIDGDGLKDIVTGKTYWSHHKQSPMWDAGAVVYWFGLERTSEGVKWVPHRADDEAGIGRQISVVDVNGDQLPDIVVGGMKGCHVLIHHVEHVDEATWQKAQPKEREGFGTLLKRGPSSKFTEEGVAPGAIEAESLSEVKPASGQVSAQEMQGFHNDRWSGGQQLFWTGGQPGDRLELPFEVKKTGDYALEGVFTMAGDYAMIEVDLDGKKVAGPIDLYNFPDVVTTGVLKLAEASFTEGKHVLGVTIVGSNPSAAPAGMVGVDYFRLVPSGAAK
jgi:hypothetical protein